MIKCRKMNVESGNTVDNSTNKEIKKRMSKKKVKKTVSNSQIVTESQTEAQTQVQAEGKDKVKNGVKEVVNVVNNDTKNVVKNEVKDAANIGKQEAQAEDEAAKTKRNVDRIKKYRKKAASKAKGNDKVMQYQNTDSKSNHQIDNPINKSCAKSDEEIREEVEDFVNNEIAIEKFNFTISDLHNFIKNENLGLSLFMSLYLKDNYVQENKGSSKVCYKFNGTIWVEDESNSVCGMDTLLLEILDEVLAKVNHFVTINDNEYRKHITVKNPEEIHPYEDAMSPYLDALNTATTLLKKTPNFKTILDRAFAGDVRKGIPSLIYPTDMFDNDAEELNTPEGIIDLTTGEIRDIKPDDLRRRCTTSAMFSPEELNIDMKNTALYRTITDIFKPIGYPEPYEYNHELSKEQNNKNRDIYEEELDKWKSGYYANISFDFMQTCLGYMTLGTNFLQKFFIAIGDCGRNGKGIITHMLKDVLGKKYVNTSRAETFMLSKFGRNPGNAAPDLMKLRYARITLIEENNRKVEIDAALIKRITGDDGVSARALWGDEIDFKSQAVPFFVTNYVPNFDVYDNALEARCIRIPFLRRFMKESEIKDPNSPFFGILDPHLQKELKKERELILYWIVQGAIKASKLVSLDAPDIFKRYTEKYRRERDYIQLFIDEYCNIGEDDHVSRSDLYKAFRIFAEESGFHSGSNQRFYQNLEMKGYKRNKSNGVRGFKGLSLNDEGLDLLLNSDKKYSKSSNTVTYTDVCTSYNSSSEQVKNKEIIDQQLPFIV